MTMYLDTDRMRVIYQWNESRVVIMNKNLTMLEKARKKSLRITPLGRICKRDLYKWSGHPKLRVAKQFIETLKSNKFFKNKNAELEIKCDVCGDTFRVFPHYDVKNGVVVWRCAEHRFTEINKMISE